MLKWIFILLFLGIVLSALLQQKIQQLSTTTDAGQTPTVSVRASDVKAVSAQRPATVVANKKGRLSLREERLMNRVPPVHEAPLKEDILPQ